MGLTQNLGRLSPSIFSDASLNIGVGAAPSGSYKFEVTGTSKVSGVLTLGSTLSNGTYTYTLPAATGTLALVGGAGVGTVTSVAALTLGTTGTDLSSTVANSTTTPVITLNVPTASAANRGALSSADWSTFNSKQGTITLTTTGTSGAATFTSNTLNIPDYGSALSGYLPLTGGTLTGALNGTSASFSGTIQTSSATTGGSVKFNYGANTVSRSYIIVSDAYNYGDLGFQQSTTQTGSTYSNKMILAANGDLTIGSVPSTGVGNLYAGAATFSSSVTTNANFINSGPVYSTTGNVGNLLFTNTYPSNYNVAQIASVLDGYFYAAKLVFRTADSANANLLVDRLTIASSGAATFSSSVNVNTYLSLGTGSGKFLAVGGAVTAGSSADILMYNTGGDIYFWTTGAVGLKIAASTGTATFSTSIITPSLYGKSYAQTSTSGTTSYVDTGIYFNTSITGFSNNAIYELVVSGNPNGAGSSEYRSVYLGYIFVTTGYDFAILNVVQRISYTQVVTGDAYNIGALTISVVFWNGTTETTQQITGTTSNQIRVKITGYNSGNIGAAQVLTLNKVN